MEQECGDGGPITCDGCGRVLERVDPDMIHPAPEAVWGPDVIYIVCPPRPDGAQPCWDVARLDDQVHAVVGCADPGCGVGR